MQNIKEMSHKYSRHAIERLAERVEVDMGEADHYFDMAKIVKCRVKTGVAGLSNVALAIVRYASNILYMKAHFGYLR